MGPIAWVATLLGVIVVCVGWGALTPEPPLAAGAPHPDFPAMSIGGDGTRFFPIAWPVILWQVAALMLPVPLYALGVPRARRTAAFWTAMGACCGVSVATWLAGMALYIHGARDETAAIALGYPLSTTIVLVGLWLAGGAYTLFYVIGFRTFFLTPEDEAAFEALARDARAGTSDGQEAH
ncbi:MAG: hypothetical protein ACFB6R_07480 [Alphaproteobacteria bacterium]